MIKSPNLDDKTQSELFKASLAMVPSLTDKWTDFNPQDSGVMLLELLSAMTEMQNYYINEVGDRYYKRFLSLLIGGDAQKSPDELLADFLAESQTPGRAVSAWDYKNIVMERHGRELGLSDVNVKITGKDVLVSVRRGDRELTWADLNEIRGSLEKYRLLTMRIKVEQMGDNENGR